MKKFYRGFILAFIILCVFSLSGCSSETPEEAQARRKYEYFDVVEMINNGKYEDAKSRIDEVYADVTDYSTTEGFNKSNLLRILYETQENYDQAMDELLKMVSDNDYIEEIHRATSQDEKEKLSNNVELNVTMSGINRMIEKVSPDKKSEVLNLVGQNILDEYSKK